MPAIFRPARSPRSTARPGATLGRQSVRLYRSHPHHLSAHVQAGQRRDRQHCRHRGAQSEPPLYCGLHAPISRSTCSPNASAAKACATACASSPSIPAQRCRAAICRTSWRAQSGFLATRTAGRNCTGNFPAKRAGKAEEVADAGRVSRLRAAPASSAVRRSISTAACRSIVATLEPRRDLHITGEVWAAARAPRRRAPMSLGPS